ncbi:conjugative transposon protein TraM [Pedobacter sp. MC2016-24]|uniref:conjugative transposon protein TraM n=1 Tax=Pedobacter sp. MC2016-24 TaxID=2780090 RepID=UPI00188284AB|nr:conjugative transposon protein TraM [Pedobacter sp. MC2016-24]MBE9599903.1 conjugative transposon protein TraM [Pedobacter sp. MC2016-24]
MKINFKQPKYVIPLLILPFICLFFYVYSSSKSDRQVVDQSQANGIQGHIGSVSPEMEKKALDDKLEAYRGAYKEADGYTAINLLEEEQSANATYGSKYTSAEKRVLDSIELVMQLKQNQKSSGAYVSDAIPYASGPSGQRQAISRLNQQDQDLARALSNLHAGNESGTPTRNVRDFQQVKEKDPMEIFKAQMAYMDSVSKAGDPEYQEEMQRQTAMNKAEELRKQQIKLDVRKADLPNSVFNTVRPNQNETFIMAIIDENVTGYAGSRIRIRLLEDIKVGGHLVSKGSYLYARISGFSDQRVTLSIQSILLGNKILPVKLDLYDMDGLSGLYVPESAFREFTKDLGGNSMQGVNLQGNSQNQNQFIMSTVDRMFQSTSAAIASLIRKNKAKIKYSSFIYLIDSEELQNSQKNY